MNAKPPTQDATPPPSAELDALWTQTLNRALGLMDRIDALLPGAPIKAPDWGSAVAFRYQRRHSMRRLQALPHAQLPRLAQLQHLGPQADRLWRNTAQFLQGLPANNVLLTGARGTGKSSLIKACLAEHAGLGLRMVEVDKSDLVDLPELCDALRPRHQHGERFVLFCDDLSFEAGDDAYKALKSVLDGGLASRQLEAPLIYATSNRRHLLPEHFSDNARPQRSDEGEIHPQEAVEEKISLSERFGLWLSFYPFSQPQYLAIVEQWMRHLGATPEACQAAQAEALVWALERGSRSGRVAQQFALHACAQLQPLKPGSAE